MLAPPLPLRELMRREWPNGSHGLIVEDVDIVVRAFGRNYRTDNVGRFAEFEHKYVPDLTGPAPQLGWAQSRTFGQRARLFAKSTEYVGSWIIANADRRCCMAWGDPTLLARTTCLRLADLAGSWVSEAMNGLQLCTWIQESMAQKRKQTN
jgi:hypothetical protein